MPGEFVLLAGLAVRAWSSAVRGIGADAEHHCTLGAKFLRDLRENASAVLAADTGGGLCGWGASVPHSNYISDLWVDPGFHRQGIGVRLLDGLMAQIMLGSFETARIGTHADNLPAIALYEKAGFTVEWRGEEWSESFGRTVEKVHMRASL